MNFIQKISGSGASVDEKEENEQPITVSPLLSSSSSFYRQHHHHQPESFFSPPRYNYNRGGENEESSGWKMVEREHMFDKVVTPSDVGKLNRLVIPKQHAERFFPLDSSTNYKGLLLNFEDNNGKLWRFQYSYWNSSQSYVMTKGWSRFVKEKKLDAGDIVSFQRGVGVTTKDRLFIDWRRRVNPNTPPCNLSASSDLSFLFHNHNLVHPCSPLVLQSLPARRNPNFMLQAPNGNPNCTTFSFSSRSVGNGSGTTQLQFGLGFDHNIPPPNVQASASLTPHVHEKVSGKRRLRLFGVNMDCVYSDGADENATVSAGCSTINSLFPLSPSSSSFSTIPYLQLGPNDGGESECDQSAILSKSTVSNMSLDLKM